MTLNSLTAQQHSEAINRSKKTCHSLTWSVTDIKALLDMPFNDLACSSRRSFPSKRVGVRKIVVTARKPLAIILVLRIKRCFRRMTW